MISSLSQSVRPATADRVFRQAENLHQQGHLDQAIAVLSSFVSSHDSFAEGHYVLAIYLRMAGKYAEARDHNQRAIALHAAFPEAYINLGEIFGAP